VEAIYHATAAAAGTSTLTGTAQGETGISDEVQAVYDRMTALSPTEEDAIQVFVDGLVADGIWGKLDEFYCFALNNTDWLTGWKKSTAIHSPLGNGNVSRNKDGAIVEDTNSWLETGLLLPAQTQYQLTDGEMGIYLHASVDWGAGNNDMTGVEDASTARTRIRHRGNDNNDWRSSINTANVLTPSQTLPISRQLISVRATATNTNQLHDGVIVDTDPVIPNKVPDTYDLWIFTKNLAGARSQATKAGTTITSWYLGAGIDTVQFLSRLNTLHNSLGVTP
jgi:hypothetical protein